MSCSASTGFTVLQEHLSDGGAMTDDVGTPPPPGSKQLARRSGEECPCDTEIRLPRLGARHGANEYVNLIVKITSRLLEFDYHIAVVKTIRGSDGGAVGPRHLQI